MFIIQKIIEYANRFFDETRLVFLRIKGIEIKALNVHRY